jgi:hypothetical protein
VQVQLCIADRQGPNVVFLSEMGPVAAWEMLLKTRSHDVVEVTLSNGSCCGGDGSGAGTPPSTTASLTFDDKSDLKRITPIRTILGNGQQSGTVGSGGSGRFGASMIVDGARTPLSRDSSCDCFLVVPVCSFLGYGRSGCLLILTFVTPNRACAIRAAKRARVSEHAHAWIERNMAR